MRPIPAAGVPPQRSQRVNVPMWWFVTMATLSLVGLAAGVALARWTRHRGRAGLVVALVLLGLWAWLLHHPSVAVRVVPVEVLSWIEGSASVPVFMFIVGIAWARAGGTGQRRLVGWAVVLGCVYFINGNLWLLQTTPQVGFAETVDDAPLVKQSQDYSCVAAACATTLRLLGVRATEAEMAELTRTRPGTGSTLLRAMAGLSRRLAGEDYQVTLLEPSLRQLRTLPTPMLTPMQFETTRRHMVTLTQVGPHGVEVADPVDGSLFYSWEEFASYYTGRVIVVERPG